jgi:hypothetical protein
MVTFTRIPYAIAAKRALCQDRIMYSGLLFLFLVIAVALLRFVFAR